MFESAAFELPGNRLSRPHANCYWLVPGRILAGEYPRDFDETSSRSKMQAILAAGVTQFVDLTEEAEGPVPYLPLLQVFARTPGREPLHVRHAVRDKSVPEPAQMRAILDEIDVAAATGHCIYLHCWGGIGRTGTVVGCLLVEAGFAAEDALRLLAHKWTVMEKRKRCPASPETPEQVAFIRNWPLEWHCRIRPVAAGRT